MNEKQPFFSIIMPLYNKENYVKETIDTVKNQTFQNFELVIINDGSTDKSSIIVEEINDSRIRLINQKNSGVSVARNNGIKLAKADYIVFLDADDIWLPMFLQTIYEMIKQFKNVGLYATSYKMRYPNGYEQKIVTKGFKKNNFIGIIPNYFKSVVKSTGLVWTSAVCIPKEIFLENEIWFPEGEKYGEDLYVWARIAMKFDVCYNTNPCAIYQLETDNNCLNGIFNEKDPHQSILKLNNFKKTIDNKEKLAFFDKYIEKCIYATIFRNILMNDKKYAFHQLKKYNLSIGSKFKLILMMLIPFSFYETLRNLKKKFKI